MKNYWRHIILPFLFITILLSNDFVSSHFIYAQTSCPKKTQGDANCDDSTDLVDFEIWRKEFIGTLSTKTADFDTNGAINIVDFEIWRKGFLNITPTPTWTIMPTITPTRVTSISPTVTPTPTSNTNPSGQPMPVGDIPGWKQIFTEDFNTNVTLGNFPGTAYSNKWSVYLDGWPDTAGKNGKPSQYYPSKVITVNNGVLNKYLHSENGKSLGAAVLPKNIGQLYGKYTVRFRSEALQGFKTAWLLWPNSETWPRDGEIDFPEGDLASTIHAYMHRQGSTTGSDQDAFSTNMTYAAWHTASIEWSPNKVDFILDGTSIGVSTVRVPNTPMHWVLQTESCLDICPAASGSANLQIDWVVAYAPF